MSIISDGASRRVIKSRGKDRLSRWAAEADAHGMHYGDYVALLRDREQKIRDKVRPCAYCGHEFKPLVDGQIYHDTKCYLADRDRRRLA